MFHVQVRWCIENGEKAMSSNTNGVDPMANCKIGDAVLVQFNDQGQYFEATIRTMDYGAESITVRWDFNSEYCLYIDRNACSKRFWHVKQINGEPCEAESAAQNNDVVFWVTTTPGPFDDMAVARVMETNPNLAAVLSHHSIFPKKTVVEVGIVLISLMVSICLFCTFYRAYRNWKKRINSIALSKQKKKEELLETQRAAKLKKKLQEIGDDLGSEHSFLGQLGILPDTPKQTTRVLYEPEGEPGIRKVARPKSAPMSGKFGRYFKDPMPPWRQHDCPLTNLVRPSSAYPRRSTVIFDRKKWLTQEWGPTIPTYPMDVSNPVQPPTLDQWRWNTLQEKLDEAEKVYYTDTFLLEVHGVKSGSQKDPNAVEVDEDLYVQNVRTQACQKKKDSEAMDKLKGPYLSQAVRNTRFDLFRPEIQNLMQRVDDSRTRRLNPQLVISQVFADAQKSALGPEMAIAVRRTPRDEFTLNPKELTWINHDSPLSYCSSDADGYSLVSSESESSASSVVVSPSLPPLPNGPPLPGAGPYEMMTNNPSAGKTLVDTVQIQSGVNASPRRSVRNSSSPRSTSPAPLSARVKPRTLLKVERRLGESMGMTQSLRCRTGDTPVIDDKDGNVYLGMQVRDDERERKIEDKASRRYHRQWSKAIEIEQSDHHIRDDVRATRHALQQVLSTVQDTIGTNSNVSQTGQFARGSAAWSLLVGNPPPTAHQEHEEAYDVALNAFLRPTPPQVSVSSVDSSKRTSRVSFGSTFHVIREKNAAVASGIAVQNSNIDQRDHVEIEISVPDEVRPSEHSKVHSATLLEPSLGLFASGSRIQSSKFGCRKPTDRGTQQINLPGQLP